MLGSKEESLSPEISPCKGGGSTPRIGVGTVVYEVTLAASYCGDPRDAPK
jgi:hypothetical protein